MTNRKKIELFCHNYKTFDKADIKANVDVPDKEIDTFLKEDYEKLSRGSEL